MLRTLPFIFILSVLFACAGRPAPEVVAPARPVPSFDAVINVTVLHGVKAITVTHAGTKEAYFDHLFRFDEPKTVIDGMCESPQGPMRCLWWQTSGRECETRPNMRDGAETCRTYERSGTMRQGFGLPATSIAFDRVDDAVTTRADALTHLQVMVMIGRQGTQLD